MHLFDVRVMNKFGVWMTDMTTGSRFRATERAKFLMPRAHAVKVEDIQGRTVHLVGA